MSRARQVAAGLVALLAVAGCDSEPCPGAVQVLIRAPDGAERLGPLCADLAGDEAARKIGLSLRETLPAGEGLLIVAPLEGEICITNEPVAFPIDAIFADDSGLVVAVDRALPAGDPTLHCQLGVRRVLEVAAGVALEVASGDRLGVIW